MPWRFYLFHKFIDGLAQVVDGILISGSDGIHHAVAQIYTTYYNIYYSCTPDDAPLLTVLVVAFPILIPFFLLGLRKKENGMPPRSEYTGK